MECQRVLQGQGNALKGLARIQRIQKSKVHFQRKEKEQRMLGSKRDQQVEATIVTLVKLPTITNYPQAELN